jgi:diacylglycerol diphosphate phosphatase / phosphatidate phosphatase
MVSSNSALRNTGHTSWSTTGMGFLSLWLAGKLRAYDAQRGGQPWRLVVSLLPLCLAVYVGLTRIIDYW